ncbi:MFS general substrate transporter [Nadsonia fulvescens var. elongata DSM 6958]|uniref:MFS general substrate transporter n=1 Tax=Nadsonia fulvescens var. elongata DSM 6958 TaxID=857566 RepID=A0A1E3PN76_9ASCO|nr:MFS general substrate transporter [Nadsonia fulvescens var. elongata DSM 6958]
MNYLSPHNSENNEKGHKVQFSAETSSTDSEKNNQETLGVRKVKVISQQYGTVGRGFVYFSTFLVAYAYGLDSTLRYIFQATATNSYAQHSLLSTINVIRSIIAVAAQPTIARLSDVFGRVELFVASILFYTVGTIIESQAYDVQRFAGGAILYQVGFTGCILLLEVLIADLSFLNWRLFCSFVPALPFIINTWVGANVSAAIGDRWSWGIGMWAIIFPVACLPLIFCLVHMAWRAKKNGDMDQFKHERSDYQRLGLKGLLIDLFWKLDVIGVILLVAFLACFLTPFTLAGGVSANWKKANILAPLIIGFLCLPAFVYWESKAKFPVTPIHLLKDRGVWAALCIGCFINFVWYMQGDFMYTVLIVAVNESVTSATRIVSLYSFVSVITGTLLGIVVVYVRRLKGFIVFGAVIWLVSMGMLVHFRGGTSSHEGIIGSLCLMGFGAGFFTYSTQASIQSCVTHAHMAVITSIYLASYNVGSALGGTISGAIWTQVLPNQIAKHLSPELTALAYGSPFTFIIDYPWGTVEREGVVIAYRYVQKLLCIVGVTLCMPLIGFTLLLRDKKLGSVQSIEDLNPSDEARPKFN